MFAGSDAIGRLPLLSNHSTNLEEKTLNKFVSFVVRHDQKILNSIAVAFLIPMLVLVVVDMDNLLAVGCLLMGYLVVAGAVLAIIGSDIRRDHRAM